jgi:translation elongation factor EF-G
MKKPELTEKFTRKRFRRQNKSLVLLGEVIDSIMDGWKLVVDAGPLAKEPLMKTSLSLRR